MRLNVRQEIMYNFEIIISEIKGVKKVGKNPSSKFQSFTEGKKIEKKKVKYINNRYLCKALYCWAKKNIENVYVQMTNLLTYLHYLGDKTLMVSVGGIRRFLHIKLILYGKKTH